MKAIRTLVAVAALTLALALTACGGSSILTLELLDEADGVKVMAENAGIEDVVTSEGAITVKEGDVIIISPCMDSGSFNLTITSSDGKTVAYDDIAEGRVLFQTAANPGTYDVQVSGNNATGWMTVFSYSADEFDKENESLAEALEDAGVDPSVLSKG